MAWGAAAARRADGAPAKASDDAVAASLLAVFDVDGFTPTLRLWLPRQVLDK
jgi:hypothetical protein